MSNQDRSGEPHPVPSESWAIICDEFPDLRRWAYRTEQADRFHELRRQDCVDEVLLDWQAFREEMLQRERDERDVVKESWSDAYERMINGSETGPIGQAVYTCPTRRCARRAHADAPGERPWCDLSDSPMNPNS
ncbi:hypothetical protein [Micromonospora sp. CMU55-4]|uniref:hypothetical protein n=1 Tax=Micromonospora sp. CMU55-4 TaxID=2717028 RepID=UPI00140A8A09|nr:hypothetical protein [Micromonospora sp. CMU55-4]NHO85129.1 hypothetical protein [Micromonospora sp. CMU55-4]